MSTSFDLSAMTVPRSEAEQIARYKAAHANCYGNPKKRFATTTKRVVMRLPEWFIPEWKREPTEFDRHIVDWREWSSVPTIRLARQFAVLQAEVLGLSYGELVTQARSDRAVAARDMIAFDLADRWSRLSNDDIGMVLGREHTSVRAMIAREAQKRGVETPLRDVVLGSRPGPRKSRLERIDWDGVLQALQRGDGKEVVAKQFGVSLRSLHRVRREKGWP